MNNDLFKKTVAFGLGRTELILLIVFSVIVLVPITLFPLLGSIEEINKPFLINALFAYNSIAIAIILPLALIVYAFKTQKTKESFFLGLLPYIIYTIVLIARIWSNIGAESFTVLTGFLFFGFLLGAIGLSASIIKQNKLLGTILMATTLITWLMTWIIVLSQIAY